MKIEFDPAKNEANLAKHGVDFAEMRHFVWETARVAEDARLDYGEARFHAQGFIGERLYILVFTLRGTHCRIISLRKSNLRERKSYENIRQKNS